MDQVGTVTEKAGGSQLSELQRILQELRHRIATREIPPGSKLQEHAMAREFGISRVRVREVLLALQQRGLVERHPNRGAIVIKLDLKTVFDIFDVRENLEGLCVRLATEKVPPVFWQDTVELFAGPMERYAAEGDFDSYLVETDRFRWRTIEAADNAILHDMLASIYDKARAIIDRTTMLPGRLEVGLKQLQAVVRAMRDGNADLAERLRRENIRSQREFVRRYQNYVL